MSAALHHPGEAWTPELDDLILSLRATEPPTPYGQIADLIGAGSRDRVKARHERIKDAIRAGREPRSQHSSRNWTAAEVEEAIQLRLAGESFAAIGARFGRSPKAVQDKLPNLKLEQAASIPQCDHPRVQALRQEGVSCEEIALQLTLPRQSVVSLCSIKGWQAATETTSAPCRRHRGTNDVDPLIARYREKVVRACSACGQRTELTRFVFRCARCRSLVDAQ